MAISSIKDNYLDRIDLLSENEQTIFLTIVEKYVDFAAEENTEVKASLVGLETVSSISIPEETPKPKDSPEVTKRPTKSAWLMRTTKKKKPAFFGLLLE